MRPWLRKHPSSTARRIGALTETGQRWTLFDRLAGPWVQELRFFWQHTRRTGAESRAVVELSGVTFIDENGESLLSEMRSAGVEVVAAGAEACATWYQHLTTTWWHRL